MLARWLKKSKLKRIERKLKRLHTEQKDVRHALHDLDEARRKGKVTGPDHAAKHAKLEARKKALTDEVNTLMTEEHALKAELAKPAG
ncbi:MAG TPA: hypothetical protein VM889_05700 [Candidatus Thermoplasmatota archaeon]|nr:hypothetical protein [Candidatus Thermoplasmatota archaeon]